MANRNYLLGTLILELLEDVAEVRVEVEAHLEEEVEAHLNNNTVVGTHPLEAAVAVVVVVDEM